MFWDPMYFVIIGPAFLIALLAQIKVKSTFSKYSRVVPSSGYSGAQAAKAILDANGIYDVSVEPARGFLTDHYDPRNKKLRLSEDVYSGRSLASIGVAAHEVGHAIQHAHGYTPLRLRSTLVPMTMFGSQLAMPLFFFGWILGSFELAIIGALLFALVVVFQFVTLPVEFNASTRAIAQLQATGIVRSQEAAQAKKVLNAAALTYVAAAVQALLTLVYFLLRLGLLGGGDE